MRKKWALGFKWSKQELNFLKENFDKRGVNWCADKMKRTRNSIQVKAKKEGIKITREGLFWKNHQAKIKKQYQRRGNPNYTESASLKRPRQTGHKRAQARFQLQPCRICHSAKSERHHKDGDSLNNRKRNIDFLCRKHHMEADGRMKNLKQNVR